MEKQKDIPIYNNGTCSSIIPLEGKTIKENH
jgi:hypothetical protein